MSDTLPVECCVCGDAVEVDVCDACDCDGSDCDECEGSGAVIDGSPMIEGEVMCPACWHGEQQYVTRDWVSM